MQFKDIIGQQALKKKLIQAVKDNRVSHAQLFLGPPGSGNLALAIAFAQYLNCEQPGPQDSCGSCSSCRKYSKLIHPDLHFSFPFYAKSSKETAADYLPAWRAAVLENPYLSLDSWRAAAEAENKQANINMEECHRLIRALSLKSFEAPYKVLILWLPEYLGKNGNSLLKLIEEPAERTLFLLVAHKTEAILTTILSRTQLLKINKPDLSAITAFLTEQKGADLQKAEQIAYMSEGNVEKALLLLNEKNDLHLYADFRAWILMCYKDQGAELAEFTEKTLSRLGRENQKSFLHYGINILRETLLYKNELAALMHLSGEEEKLAQDFSPLFSLEQIQAMIALFEEAIFHIERNANPKILFLDVSLQLVLVIKYQTLPQGTQYI